MYLTTASGVPCFPPAVLGLPQAAVASGQSNPQDVAWAEVASSLRDRGAFPVDIPDAAIRLPDEISIMLTSPRTSQTFTLYPTLPVMLLVSCTMTTSSVRAARDHHYH